MKPNNLKGRVSSRSSSWCLVSTQAATDLWLLEWPQPLDLSVGWCQLEHITGKGELKPYNATPIITTYSCCELVFFVVSEYTKFKKKIHQPELDWKYWKGKFLDLLFAVTFLRWRNHSGDVTLDLIIHQDVTVQCFTVSHNHGTPPLPPKQPPPHKIH